MKELCSRVDGAFLAHRFCAVVLMLARSAACSSFGGTQRRVYPVCVQVDQLPSHARDERQEHCEDVGHLPRSSLPFPPPPLLTLSQAEGSDAFSEFHLYVCLAFLVKWSDQLRGMDFQVRSPPLLPCYPADPRWDRRSSCSFSRCRRRIGRTRIPNCCLARRSCGRGRLRLASNSFALLFLLDYLSSYGLSSAWFTRSESLLGILSGGGSKGGEFARAEVFLSFGSGEVRSSSLPALFLDLFC